MLNGMTLDGSTSGHPALARFLRTVAAGALELAAELEAADSLAGRPLASLELGALQRQVAEAPGMDTVGGVSPREITRSLDRGDEPNIRTALTRLKELGVAELLPGPGPQRWRLAQQYRP